MAKLPIGEKVFIIETGEIGYIIDHYPDFMAAVDIDGMLVKVHETGIIAAREFGVSGKKDTEKVPQGGNSDLSKQPGIWYVMKIIRSMAGEITRYDILLVNNTEDDLLFLYEYIADATLQQKIRKEIKKAASFLLHEFKPDQLNDNPVCKFEFWEKKDPNSSTHHFKKEIRIRAKSFFAKLDSAIQKKEDYLWFEIIKQVPEKKEQKADPEWDMEEIENAYAVKKQKEEIKRKSHEVVQKANMPDFIDLHIEKLEKDHQLLSSPDMLRIQLRHCRNFIDRAIQFRLEKIYLIHGIGKGVLKQEIEKLLIANPDVLNYNNNYHPRFGYGATEVFLQ